MQERQLVQHGPSTLMISLPAKWLKKHELEKGDSLFVDETENEIVLRQNPKKSKKTISIEITKLQETSIRAILTNLYRQGYDHITIVSRGKNISAFLEQEVRTKLVGFEITEKKSDLCVIESILEPSLDQFDNILSKYFLNIRMLIDYFNTKNYDAVELENIERQIISFDNFCRRVISKEQMLFGEYLLLFLSTIHHAQRELYFALQKLNGKKCSDSLLLCVKECGGMFDLLKAGFYDNQLQKLEEVHTVHDGILKMLPSLFNTKVVEESIIAQHLVSAARNFYLASSPLVSKIFVSKKE